MHSMKKIYVYISRIGLQFWMLVFMAADESDT